MALMTGMYMCGHMWMHMNGKLLGHILVLHYYSWVILRSAVPVVKICGFSHGFSHGRHGFSCQDTWFQAWFWLLWFQASGFVAARRVMGSMPWVTFIVLGIRSHRCVTSVVST